MTQAPHPDGDPSGALPRDTEPGGASTPRDTEGDGPVGLEDRTGTDEKGAPAANQAKAEPMPSTQGHPDPDAPLEPPLLGEMNVGADDPQRPSFGEPRPAGPAGPADAPREPGVEHVETDVDASAGGMVPDTGRPAGAGDPQGVPVPSETASAGTSEEHGAVQGARIPLADDRAR